MGFSSREIPVPSKSGASSSYGSMERPTRSTDLLWDLAPEPALGAASQLLQETLMRDSAYGSPDSAIGSPQSKERLRYTKHLYGLDDDYRPPVSDRQDVPPYSVGMYQQRPEQKYPHADTGSRGMYPSTAPAAGPPHSQSNPQRMGATSTSMPCGQSRPILPSSSANQMASLGNSATTMETWSNLDLQEAMGIERSLLAQLGAHLTPQQLERIASSARVGLGNTAEKKGSESVSASLHPRSQMQPIRVMTGGASSCSPSVSGWSGPSTPTSMVQHTPPNSSTMTLDQAQIQNARLQLLQQRAAQAAKYSPRPPVSQTPSSMDKRTNPFPSNRPPHPFFPPGHPLADPAELKQAAAALAALAAGERYSALEGAEHNLQVDFPLRSHLIEEFLPPDYANIPPPPFGMKLPPGVPPHLSGSPPYGPDGREFLPPHFDPYFHGRLPPPFFGPNEMFFDVLPPHFFGLPPFFPGFKPPRLVVHDDKFTLECLQYISEIYFT